MKLSDLSDEDFMTLYQDYWDCMRWGFSGVTLPPEHPRYKGAKITGPSSWPDLVDEAIRREKEFS
jgi:hypothetical protein